MLLSSSKDPLFTSILKATYVLRLSSCCTRPVDDSAAHRGNDRHHKTFPEKIMGELAGIIDNTENGMTT
jgi:hypothetical protein